MKGRQNIAYQSWKPREEEEEMSSTTHALISQILKGEELYDEVLHFKEKNNQSDRRSVANATRLRRFCAALFPLRLDHMVAQVPARGSVCVEHPGLPGFYKRYSGEQSHPEARFFHLRSLSKG